VGHEGGDLALVVEDGARLSPAGLRSRYRDFRENWFTLGVYERFEQVVALVLTAIIAVIVVVSVWQLSRDVLFLVWRGFPARLGHEVFQAVFGQIATVLIALEFKHSIVKVVAARHTIVQVRTVILIAVLALARKFIILEAQDYSAPTILALAAVVLALGVAYWRVRETDARRALP